MTITGATVELYNTDGSAGAARGAGIGVGIYKDYKYAFVGLKCTNKIEPNEKLKSNYNRAYNNWLNILKKTIE